MYHFHSCAIAWPDQRELSNVYMLEGVPQLQERCTATAKNSHVQQVKHFQLHAAQLFPCTVKWLSDASAMQRSQHANMFNTAAKWMQTSISVRWQKIVFANKKASGNAKRHITVQYMYDLKVCTTAAVAIAITAAAAGLMPAVCRAMVICCCIITIILLIYQQLLLLVFFLIIHL